MKKFILMMVMMFTAMISMNAQTVSTSNYVGSSKFSDNWSVTLQGGVVTPMSNFFSGHTAMTPVVVLGADKYVNRWFGLGVDGRTAIGTGCALHNSPTAFDMVNVNGYAKVNLANVFAWNGTRRMFEPVLYTGLGWGHATAGVTDALGNHTHDNYMTYRVGTEFNFNLGTKRAWAVVVNPAVIWGDINNGRLSKQNGNFELTAGVVYHFKTSNGTHGFTRAKLYDQAEVDRLNATINELRARKPEVVTKVVEKTVPATNAAATVTTVSDMYKVMFAKNSDVLTDDAKKVLDTVPANTTVDVFGSTSPEGTSARNTVLAQLRADAVAKYLRARGVNVRTSAGGDNGRNAVIHVVK